MFGFGIRKQQQVQQQRSRFGTPAYVRAQDRRPVAAYEPVDYVTLADGTTVAVPRANLAAAKALLAAQKAAERRVVQTSERHAIVVIRELPVLDHDELMAS